MVHRTTFKSLEMRAVFIIGLLSFMLPFTGVHSLPCNFGFFSFLCDILGLNQDPIVKMNSPQIIEYYGFPVEIHTIVTDDGYIIDMHRIPFGKNESASSIGRPVLILHGLYSESVSWLWNPPDSALPFVLYNAGYDVWLGNVRGNNYGMKHVNISSKTRKFWQFSWDEIAQYDVSKMIDTIINKTGYDQIIYIGYSMGTTVMFALLSDQPDYNSKVKLFVALAPAAYSIGHPPAIRVLAKLAPSLFNALGAVTHDQFNPNSGLVKFALEKLCGVIVVNSACSNILQVVFGSDPAQYNKSRTQIYLSKLPASSSYNAIEQYVQEAGAGGNFTHFDFGPAKNKAKYGQATPPHYNVYNIHAPVALIWAQNDIFATPQNVAYLKSLLRNVVWYYAVTWPKFTHNDFQSAIDLNSLVHEPLLEKMAEYK